MRFSAPLIVGAMLSFLAITLLPQSAEAGVQVTFINSFYYSDLAGKPPDKREATLSEIRNAFVDVGGRFLKPGQTLKIKVLDMQLIKFPSSIPSAGSKHTSKADARSLRMEVQYALQQGGKTLAQARDSISDVSYLANPIPPGTKKSPSLIRIEEMLQAWFAATFGASESNLQ